MFPLILKLISDLCLNIRKSLEDQRELLQLRISKWLRNQNHFFEHHSTYKIQKLHLKFHSFKSTAFVYWLVLLVPSASITLTIPLPPALFDISHATLSNYVSNTLHTLPQHPTNHNLKQWYTQHLTQTHQPHPTPPPFQTHQAMGSAGSTHIPSHVMPLRQHPDHHTPFYELRRIVKLQTETFFFHSTISSAYSCKWDIW